MGGPEMAPQTPQRSERPGGAVALLYHAIRTWGPETAPKSPSVRSAPAEPWRSLNTRFELGAPKWPPKSPTFGAPRVNRGAPRSRARGFARQRLGRRRNDARI